MVVLYNDHFLFLFFWSQVVILKASDKFVVRSDYQQGMSGYSLDKALRYLKRAKKKRGNSMVDKYKTHVLMHCSYFGVSNLQDCCVKHQYREYRKKNVTFVSSSSSSTAVPQKR